ncbi:hypothetical protein KOI40_04515 [Aestuariicella sp. G3-2]|uniref:hypothetical protein n=1 Tax=Pseudomaricurvus albidus TaxID=2842452 RepID=UPI001C0CC0E1|nr:hypothetical protein [Aestuariicella albida]MBU3069071.1 hypothetical protein [Aestuariicella albida]
MQGLKGLCLLLALPIFLSEASEQAPSDSYDFSDYPSQVSSMTLSQIDLNSHPSASNFRTRFKALQGRPANFAGHYILVYWGCGSGCQMFSIVDVETGQIFMDDDWSSSMGVCVRADSSLLIVNPGVSEPARMQSTYYHWDGEQLVLLREGSLPEVEAGCDGSV